MDGEEVEERTDSDMTEIGWAGLNLAIYDDITPSP